MYISDVGNSQTYFEKHYVNVNTLPFYILHMSLREMVWIS